MSTTTSYLNSDCPCKKPKLEEEEESYVNSGEGSSAVPLAPKASRNEVTGCDKAEILPFHKFTSEVLYADPLTKTIAVSGKFSDSTELGVIVAEKTPLTHSSLQRLFCSYKVEKKFQNDVYSQYVLDSEKGGAGEVRVTTVYPATDEHVKKYGAQKRRFVRETPELYQNVTKPFIERQSFSLDVCKLVVSGLLF